MRTLRRWVWVAGAPIRALLIGAIFVYRASLSGALGGQCRFYPSCSHYAEAAIRKRGAVVGVILSVWRVARCNPFGSGGVEFVSEPPRPRESREYDKVIRTGWIGPS